jgi:hypothetical protein
LLTLRRIERTCFYFKVAVPFRADHPDVAALGSVHGAAIRPETVPLVELDGAVVAVEDPQVAVRVADGLDEEGVSESGAPMGCADVDRLKLKRYVGRPVVAAGAGAGEPDQATVVVGDQRGALTEDGAPGLDPLVDVVPAGVEDLLRDQPCVRVVPAVEVKPGEGLGVGRHGGADRDVVGGGHE